METELGGQSALKKANLSKSKYQVSSGPVQLFLPYLLGSKYFLEGCSLLSISGVNISDEHRAISALKLTFACYKGGY